MADKKLNDLAQIPSIGNIKNIYVEDAYGNQYKVSKESLAEVLGGLIGVATAEKDGLMPSSYFENGKFKLINIEYNVPVRIGRVRGILLLQAPWRAVELSMFLITRIGIVTIHDAYGYLNLLSLDSEGYLVWIENEPTHKTVRCWFQELNITES